MHRWYYTTVPPLECGYCESPVVGPCSGPVLPFVFVTSRLGMTGEAAVKANQTLALVRIGIMLFAAAATAAAAVAGR